MMLWLSHWRWPDRLKGCPVHACTRHQVRGQHGWLLSSQLACGWWFVVHVSIAAAGPAKGEGNGRGQRRVELTHSRRAPKCEGQSSSHNGGGGPELGDRLGSSSACAVLLRGEPGHDEASSATVLSGLPPRTRVTAVASA